MSERRVVWGSGRLLGLVVAAVAALPSGAQAFPPGPYNALHQPTANATTAGVSIEQDPNDNSYVVIDPTLACPGGSPTSFTVAIADPTGEVTDTLTNGCTGITCPTFPECQAVWSPSQVSGSPGFETTPGNIITYAGDEIPGDEITVDGGVGKLDPLTITVSGPGGVLLQGPFTIADYSSRTIKSTSIPLCFMWGAAIVWRASDDYCDLPIGFGETINAGWPAPTYVIDPANAPWWLHLADRQIHPNHLLTLAPTDLSSLSGALYNLLVRVPATLTVGACATTADNRVACRVSWRTGGYRFAGSETLWDLNSQTPGGFSVVFKVKRTAPHHRTIPLSGPDGTGGAGALLPRGTYPPGT